MKPVIPSKSLEYNDTEKLGYIAETLNRHSLQFLASTLLKDSIPTIRNEIRLPAFIRFYTNYEVKYNLCGIFHGRSQEYIYNKKPPSLTEIIKSCEKSKKGSKGFHSMETQEFNQELFGESATKSGQNKNSTEKKKNIELDRKLK